MPAVGLLGMVALVVLLGAGLYGFFGALRKLDRRADSGGEAALEALALRVERLEGVMEAVRALEAQLADVEERLDFTERVLAQARDPGRLPGGRGA